MWIEATLTKCLIDKLYSANDFRDIANHQNALQTECTQKVKTPSIKHSSQDNIIVTTRSLTAYTSILGGEPQ